MISHGGKREGAGRPKGSGKYAIETTPIRVPNDKISIIENILNGVSYSLPIFTNKVSAGFPSPADDHSDQKLDLNSYLIKKPSSTFFVRVTGDSMINVGINPGDILVVDRSIEPRHNKIVIASVDSEMTVKRLYKKDGKLCLLAENSKYPPIIIGNESELQIWGIVTSVIHEF